MLLVLYLIFRGSNALADLESCENAISMRCSRSKFQPFLAAPQLIHCHLADATMSQPQGPVFSPDAVQSTSDDAAISKL